MASTRPAAANDKSDASSGDFQPPSREAMDAIRASMKTIREATQTKIAALLSDDQKIKFAVWEKKRARSSAQQENDDMPPPPPDGQGGPPDGGGPGGGGPPGV